MSASSFPIPGDETKRIQCLNSYQVLDTDPDPRFDRITQFATELLDVPIAVVSLVDEARQWFKSSVALDATETSRDVAFCAHAILCDNVMEVIDATKDPRFSGNPLVTGELGIRFYAGAPLKVKEGYTLGTLCVIDQKPKQLSDREYHVLTTLANLVVDELELHRAIFELENAQTEMLSLSRVKGDFLAKMSHEIRTPMNGVLGMADLLQETDLSDEQQELTSTIKQSGQTLLHIINDILDFSRIEAGRLGIRPVSFDVSAFIEEVIHLFVPDFKEKQIDFISEISHNMPKYVYGDPDRLRQIFVNLFDNALKFTSSGGEVKLKVRTQQLDSKKAVFEFQLSDTGVGIPEDRHKEIFEAFKQSDNSSTREYGGAGLGLTISSQLVKLMGGKIAVDSTPGKGSVFSFTISLGLSSTPRSFEENLVQKESGTKQRALQILLAEDNLVNQKVAKRTLEKEGHTVTVAKNGKEAVDCFMKDDFDVVLMDIHMPVMDGEEAFKAIRKLSDRRYVPVVALTASLFEESKERLFDLGMDGFISKPFEKEELFSTLEEVVNTHLKNKDTRT